MLRLEDLDLFLRHLQLDAHTVHGLGTFHGQETVLKAVMSGILLGLACLDADLVQHLTELLHICICDLVLAKELESGLAGSSMLAKRKESRWGDDSWDCVDCAGVGDLGPAAGGICASWEDGGGVIEDGEGGERYLSRSTAATGV